jgi:hypothetical protein
MTLQDNLYIEALSDLSPEILSQTCKEIIRENDRFPTPNKIRAAAKEIGERISAARTLANPSQQGDLGATLRNEAILLLGCFHYELAWHLESPSENYKIFLQAAATTWNRVRPSGGLDEVDAVRRGRANFGFALEAWARKKLGYPPLHRNYVTDKIAEVYSHMTGQAIERLDPAYDDLPQVNPKLWAKVTGNSPPFDNPSA